MSEKTLNRIRAELKDREEFAWRVLKDEATPLITIAYYDGAMSVIQAINKILSEGKS